MTHRIVENLAGENFGEFAANRQVFSRQNFPLYGTEWLLELGNDVNASPYNKTTRNFNVNVTPKLQKSFIMSWFN